MGGAATGAASSARSARGFGLRGQWLAGIRLPLLERIAASTPSIKSSGKRPHAGKSMPNQDVRRTGARGLVGSGAVQNDFAVLGNAEPAVFDVGRVHAHGAGEDRRGSIMIELMAKVHDYHVFAAIQPGF